MNKNPFTEIFDGERVRKSCSKWMEWPTCMITSRMRAWVKVRQLAIENVWGIPKRVLKRSISLLRGKTDRLRALIYATQRVGVFISESDGCIAVR